MPNAKKWAEYYYVIEDLFEVEDGYYINTFINTLFTLEWLSYLTDHTHDIYATYSLVGTTSYLQQWVDYSGYDFSLGIRFNGGHPHDWGIDFDFTQPVNGGG